jgi:hypothetical protein
MKTSVSCTLVAGLAIALALMGCSTSPSTSSTSSATAANDAHLTVYRIANFGAGVILLLSVDGKQLAQVPRGQNYDGYLTPGTHFLSATVAPNFNTSPWQKQLNVKAGQAYSFTATWQGPTLALVQNQ